MRHRQKIRFLTPAIFGFLAIGVLSGPAQFISESFFADPDRPINQLNIKERGTALGQTIVLLHGLAGGSEYFVERVNEMQASEHLIIPTSLSDYPSTGDGGSY